MSNTITSSFPSKASTWLREQTSPKKAENENTIGVVRWVSRQTKATNLSAACGILWLLTLAVDHLTKNHDNKFFRALTKGIKWVSGIATLVLPLANLGIGGVARFDIKEKVINAIARDLGIPKFSLGELHVPDKYTTYERYNHDNACNLIAILLEECIEGELNLDEVSKDLLRRTLVLNPKVPIEASGHGIQGTVIPQTSRSKAYRLGIYKTILSTLQGDSKLLDKDPLFLKTPIAQAPDSTKKTRVKGLRDALVSAHLEEVGLEKTNSKNYDRDIVKKIEEILHIAGEHLPTEMPKWTWEPQAQAQRVVELENEKRLVEFKKWGSNIPACRSSSRENFLDKVFSQLDQEQKENLDVLRRFYNRKDFKSVEELNNALCLDSESNPGVLNIMDLDNTKEKERLCEGNSEKGLFFFNYLDSMLDRAVSIAGSPQKQLKEYLDPQIKGHLCAVSMRIVNDKVNFPNTIRNYAFYTAPTQTTVPEQALILYHKFVPCFTNSGYVDIYNIKDRMIDVAVSNFSPEYATGRKVQNGFLLSGPIGTGKTAAAKALANQLAVPLFTIKRNIISYKDGSFVIKIDNFGELPLGYFLQAVHEVKCVLLFDEVDKILVPKNSDPERRRDATREEEALTAAFLPDLQDHREEQNKSASNNIIIYTTNYPDTRDIDVSQINRNGDSLNALAELKKDVSSAGVRSDRIDFHIFSFHKLYDTKQAEALARHFLEEYIDSGRLEELSSYSEIAARVKDYTPHDIELTFQNVAKEKTGKLTIDDMMDGLNQVATRSSALVYTEREETLKSIIQYLTKFGGKKLNGQLDIKELAIASKGLHDEQIRVVFEELTPEVLTQENILDAFEKLKS